MVYDCVTTVLLIVLFLFLFCKQKTAYEVRISDWSSDVCSSDLMFGTGASPRTEAIIRPVGKRSETTGRSIARSENAPKRQAGAFHPMRSGRNVQKSIEIGRASCRERVCQYV